MHPLRWRACCTRGDDIPGQPQGFPAPSQFTDGSEQTLPSHSPWQSSITAAGQPSTSITSFPPLQASSAGFHADGIASAHQTTSAHTISPGPGSITVDSLNPAPNGTTTVEQALARAEEAANLAEASLEGIDKLPSAQKPHKWASALRMLRSVVVVGTLCVGLVASHASGLLVQWAGAVAGALGIAWWGYTRSSLSTTGALAALVVGAGTIGCSLRMGITLMAFFFASSKLTQYKEDMKIELDDSAKKGGQRDWKQVLCNGAIPTAIAIAYGVLVGCVDVPLGLSAQMEVWRAKAATLLGGAFLGYYAACCGDTWASELGPLSPATPVLITTMRPVRRGTNGGVTAAGLLASAGGGAFVGAAFYAAALVSPTLWILEGQHAAAVAQWGLILLGAAAGLAGSLLDSLLGATLQYTGFNTVTGRVTSTPGPGINHISGVAFLDNNMVNMVSASVMSGLTALAAVRLFIC